MTKLLGKSHESGEVRLSGREQTRLPKELVLSGDEQTGRSSYWERAATCLYGVHSGSAHRKLSTL